MVRFTGSSYVKSVLLDGTETAEGFVIYYRTVISYTLILHSSWLYSWINHEIYITIAGLSVL